MHKRKVWWTVILLYPDSMTEDFGADIYVEWGYATDPREAVDLVRRKAVDAQKDGGAQAVDPCDPSDFRCIAVWKGRTVLELDATNF